MHRDNYVCFHCRIVRKVGMGYTIGSCECHRPLVHTGHKWRFPKRRDKKGWKRMKEMLSNFNHYYKEQTNTQDAES